MPAAEDIHLYAGDTKRVPFRLRARLPNGGAGEYADLTGVTAKAQIRATKQGAILAEFTATIPAQVGDDLGKVVLSLTGVQTAAVVAGIRAANVASGVWDVELTYADGFVKTPLAGKVTVEEDVTRA